MNHAKQIHAHALRCGAHHETYLVLDLLLRIPNLQYAHRLLDSLVNPPSTFLYNKLLRAYSVSSVNYQVCLSIFSSMLRNRSVHRPTFIPSPF
ncbi:hypothetical protein HPP92_028333 [Vanilla planifolia]|uniref:Pentatricopeptide repeat-containing protein n=1 Tax=Vanilla planifolia TaxID=51239 RepID=A0A835P9G8_VANPL|nr:hypothetical protein HPP92_028333 [Vanilla planifolia]